MNVIYADVSDSPDYSESGIPSTSERLLKHDTHNAYHQILTFLPKHNVWIHSTPTCVTAQTTASLDCHPVSE